MCVCVCVCVCVCLYYCSTCYKAVLCVFNTCKDLLKRFLFEAFSRSCVFITAVVQYLRNNFVPLKLEYVTLRPTGDTMGFAKLGE